MLGAKRLGRNPTNHYIQTVLAGGLQEQSQRHILDLAESNASLILMGIAGIISIALGTWLETFK
jgi:hypothetical protein